MGMWWQRPGSSTCCWLQHSSFIQRQDPWDYPAFPPQGENWGGTTTEATPRLQIPNWGLETIPSQPLPRSWNGDGLQVWSSGIGIHLDPGQGIAALPLPGGAPWVECQGLEQPAWNSGVGSISNPKKKRESGGSNELPALPSTYSRRNQGISSLYSRSGLNQNDFGSLLPKGWENQAQDGIILNPVFSWLWEEPRGDKADFPPADPGCSLWESHPPSPTSILHPFWDRDWECCSWQGRPRRALSRHYPAPWYLPGSPPLGAQN